jgi:FKBP-type peptidyl-prolyl cis-trans isomerase (trigger factor)
MTTACQRLPKSTIVLTLTIPWDKVRETYDNIVTELAKEVKLPGFRKGKAPRKRAEGKLDKAKVRQEVISQLLPAAYTKAIKEHSLNPIVPPKVEIVKMEEGHDWVFKAETAEKPEVRLGNYKREIRKVKEPGTKIWTPQSKEETKKTKNKPNILGEVLDALDQSCQVELPELLVTSEVNRMLAQNLDDIKKMGLTLDSYLTATGKTAENLREEYRKQATKTLKLEFVLAEIAERENIVVEDKEVEEFVKKAPDEKTRKALSGQRYYLASLLRKQKTLDKLLNL